MIGHLQIGSLIIRDLATRAGGIDDSRLLALLNTVLSHHGAPGNTFASAEALALHRINALDAGVKGDLE